jgi:ATP-dependent protease Clp ATPase subunit
VAKLIAGPNVYICGDCVVLGEQARAVRGGRIKVAKPDARATCSFCSKRSTEKRWLWLGEHAHVCSECLRSCREIVDSGD